MQVKKIDTVNIGPTFDARTVLAIVIGMPATRTAIVLFRRDSSILVYLPSH